MKQTLKKQAPYKYHIVDKPDAFYGYVTQNGVVVHCVKDVSKYQVTRALIIFCADCWEAQEHYVIGGNLPSSEFPGVFSPPVINAPCLYRDDLREILVSSIEPIDPYAAEELLNLSRGYGLDHLQELLTWPVDMLADCYSDILTDSEFVDRWGRNNPFGRDVLVI